MQIKDYNRDKAIVYAQKWAYLRNPKFYNYDGIGGDCTNFVSQCIYEGCKTMNYDTINGWFYNNANDKSPSWTGVEFLYKFLINNKGVGPFARKCSIEELEPGDIVQLSFDGVKFAHTLFVVNNVGEKIFVATHTFDSYNRDMNTYSYKKIRFMKIEGYRIW